MLIAAVAALALAAPGVAIAQSGSSGQSGASASSSHQQAAKRKHTWIVFQFDHTRGYGTSTVVRGQIAWKPARGQVASVPGHKQVTLYRKLAGTGTWKKLGRKATGDEGRFVFKVRSKGNATYRIVFRGNRVFQPARGQTTVSVYRHFEAQLEDVTGRFHGRVIPGYAHKRIYLEKRPCAACGWHKARSKLTGRHGKFRFTVGAPATGRTWWRLRTPADTRFITSYSAVFSTERA
jgi:hypothetical protein